MIFDVGDAGCVYEYREEEKEKDNPHGDHGAFYRLGHLYSLGSCFTTSAQSGAVD
jgi:hypothetical protein